jgi:flagellin
MVQTAEGGLEETTNMLIRLRELAVQSASDTIGGQEREFLNKEYLQLKDEIDRIALSTEFNGTRVLMGQNAGDYGSELQTGNTGTSPMEIQIGKDYFSENDSLDVRNPINVIKIDLSKLNVFTEGEGSLNLGRADSGTQVLTKVDAQTSITALDGAINRVNEQRAYLGAIQNRFNSTIANLGVQIENMDTARSRIRDTDYAAETATFTQNRILEQAGTSVLSQANQMPQMALSLLQNLG